MRRIIHKFLIFFVFSFSYSYSINHIDSHVIVQITHEPKDDHQYDHWKNSIHTAIDRVHANALKKNKRSVLQKSSSYQHKKDEVFIVRLGLESGTVTLHRPSYVSYNELVSLIKKEFKKEGISVTCHKDEKAGIAGVNIGFEGEAFSLEELQTYATMSDNELAEQMNNLQKQSLFKSAPEGIVDQIEKLGKIKEMRDFFYWHLQVPTIGLLKSGFLIDIPEKCKPLAWKFSLWDLAPKQGKGVRVAVIDTGMSAFNVDVESDQIHYQSQWDDKQYKKNQSLEFPQSDLMQYGYNLVSENGLDPIEQLAINIMQYCDHKKFSYQELLKELPNWIMNFLISRGYWQIEEFLIKASKDVFVDQNKQLNKKGRDVLNSLLYGQYGILPNGENGFFHLAQLETPYSQDVILQTIPAPQITEKPETFIAGHGSFTSGIIGGKKIPSNPFIGIAPQADVIMIKAFENDGSTNKSTLNAGLQRAKMIDTQIVSMSLKITDTFEKRNNTDQTLERLVNGFDYVVAASGNNGSSKDQDYAGKKEAYPAKFKTVAFDVGAFSYDKGTYSVSPFTQREPKVGPKFAAPGFNMLAPGLKPGQKVDSNYVFMGGTSVAVPVVSGVLALILAEFQDSFYREEILKVMYKSAIRMNGTSDWQKDILLGSIDARTSLLCLHVLKSFKAKLEDEQKRTNKITYDFRENFDAIVEAVYTAMFYVPLYYGKHVKVHLHQDFIGFYKAVTSQEVAECNYFEPMRFDARGVTETVDFLTDLLYNALHSKKPHYEGIDHQLVESIHSILHSKVNLFVHLPSYAQQRIQDVLESDHPDSSYWTKHKK